MLTALQKSRPGWLVELLTFVLGDHGFFEEKIWKAHCERLSLPAKSLTAFATLAVQAAHEVADDILTTYNEALKANKDDG